MVARVCGHASTSHHRAHALVQMCVAVRTATRHHWIRGCCWTLRHSRYCMYATVCMRYVRYCMYACTGQCWGEQEDGGGAAQAVSTGLAHHRGRLRRRLSSRAVPGVCAAPTCRLTGLRRAVPGPASLLEPVSSQANQPPSAPSPAGCRPALPSWQRRRAAHRSSPRLSAGPEGRAHSGGLSWQQGLRRQIRWVAAELCVQETPLVGVVLWLLARCCGC